MVDEIRRGDVVTVALPGEFGKPRPAVVVQSDLFGAHPTLTVLPLTSTLRALPLFRIAVAPTPGNGLHQSSEVMVDKAHTVLRERIGARLGRLEPTVQREVDRALAVFLGIV